MVRAADRRRQSAPVRGPGKVTARLRVNGADYDVFIEPRRTLLDVLRSDLMLTGTKKVCDLGECGACTVLLDGIAVYSCLTLAIECQGKAIRTIEGLGDGEQLDPVQQAFLECDAYQCGFCTSGQIMALRALLDENPVPTEDEVRRAVSGNLCRCGAYQHIVEAGLRAAEISRGESTVPPLLRPELPPADRPSREEGHHG